MLQIAPIFPSFLAADKLDVDLGPIERCCYELSGRDVGRRFSNEGGYQSNNLDLKLYSALTYLLNEIEERANSLHASLMLKKYLKQEIDNAWINVNKGGDYNIPHVHPGSCFSGVFYVKAEKNCGDLFIKNPAMSLEHVITEPIVEQRNAFTATSLGVSPEPGKLVIFPSWVLHYVRANQSGSDRISIAFNTRIAAKAIA